MVTRNRRAERAALAGADPRRACRCAWSTTPRPTAPPDAVRERFPAGRRRRTAAATSARRPHARRAAPRPRFTAFADDDSWWAPGRAGARRRRRSARYPRLGARRGARARRPDGGAGPGVRRHARTAPAGRAAAAGPAGAGLRRLRRRRAHVRLPRRRRLHDPLRDRRARSSGWPLDLAAAGWDLAYVEDVVAHHHPAAERPAGRSWRVRAQRPVVDAGCAGPPARPSAASARLLAAAPPAVAVRAGAAAVARPAVGAARAAGGAAGGRRPGWRCWSATGRLAPR